MIWSLSTTGPRLNVSVRRMPKMHLIDGQKLQNWHNKTNMKVGKSLYWNESCVSFNSVSWRNDVAMNKKVQITSFLLFRMLLPWHIWKKHIFSDFGLHTPVLRFWLLAFSSSVLRDHYWHAWHGTIYGAGDWARVKCVQDKSLIYSTVSLASSHLITQCLCFMLLSGDRWSWSISIKVKSLWRQRT